MRALGICAATLRPRARAQSCSAYPDPLLRIHTDFRGAFWVSLDPAKIRREFSAERYRLAGGAPPPLDPPAWFSGGARAARKKISIFSKGAKYGRVGERHRENGRTGPGRHRDGKIGGHSGAPVCAPASVAGGGHKLCAPECPSAERRPGFFSRGNPARDPLPGGYPHLRSSSLARIPRALPALPSYGSIRTFGGRSG